MPNVLMNTRCPVCQAAFAMRQADRLVCPAGHHFRIAGTWLRIPVATAGTYEVYVQKGLTASYRVCIEAMVPGDEFAILSPGATGGVLAIEKASFQESLVRLSDVTPPGPRPAP